MSARLAILGVAVAEADEIADETAPAVVEPLLRQPKLWTRAEVLRRECPVPGTSGVYAWFFRELPHPDINAEGCHEHEGAWLLYVGISPKQPPANRRPASRQKLRTRIRYHYRGNAEGSTLRLTLGCLLSESLAISLRRVGSGRRLTFGGGEATLAEWMAENALVCWAETPDPLMAEELLIKQLDLPLNLDQNRAHPFHATLSAIRSQARREARAGGVY
jgi:hypothetical protein